MWAQIAAAGMRGRVRLWDEVRDNLSEGARFYASLQEALTALQQHIGDFCLTRRIQRCQPHLSTQTSRLVREASAECTAGHRKQSCIHVALGGCMRVLPYVW